MSEKTAKITSMSFKSEWTGNNGTIYYHAIELDNGDYGEIGCKSMEPDSIKPGSTLTYTIESRQYKGNTEYKIKAVRPNNFNGGGVKKFGGSKESDEGKMVTMSMSYAKDLVVASKAEKKLVEQADEIFNWMKSKHDLFQK